MSGNVVRGNIRQIFAPALWERVSRSFLASIARFSLVLRPQYAAAMTGTRLDKWLWAARFFKTRTLAAKACSSGRVEANHQPLRSSREVRVGDLLSIRTEGGDFEVEVLGLSDVRGPAALRSNFLARRSQPEARRKFAEERKAGLHFTPAPPAALETRPPSDPQVPRRSVGTLGRQKRVEWSALSYS